MREITVGDEVITKRFAMRADINFHYKMEKWVGSKGTVESLAVGIQGQIVKIHDWWWPMDAVELVVTKPRHIHADVMIQLANDSSLVIELENHRGEWAVIKDPCFTSSLNYRIQPPKPVKVELDVCLEKTSNYSVSQRVGEKPNVRLVYEGDKVVNVQLL